MGKVNVYEDIKKAEEILSWVEERGIGADRCVDELKSLAIELPSWGFANTGTRFGKFIQPGAANTIEEKLSDASMVHRVTGICPTVAVHVLWDFPNGYDPKIVKFAERLGIRIGAINPNVFQEQCYKYGSLANPDEGIRKKAIGHIIDSIKLAENVGSNILSIWLADGTNYPGQDDLAGRRKRLVDSLREIYSRMFDGLWMLIEYKPFEPAFYHTDIADWGVAYLLAKHTGERAKVLVDIGHHLPGTNIEHIVMWLIEEDMLGGFHFNDHKYADDDLTTGSIDPYQMFRIFNEIVGAKMRGREPKIAYMVDQSHNLKPKIEAMIQTVDVIHQLYAKALIVDRKALKEAQIKCDIVRAEEILRDAYLTDTRPLVGYVRDKMGIAPDALGAYRMSGYQEKIEAERRERNIDAGGSYA